MTAFTPKQLAGVYVSRWAARDMANRFIRQMRVSSFLTNLANTDPVFPKGQTIKIRVPK